MIWPATDYTALTAAAVYAAGSEQLALWRALRRDVCPTYLERMTELAVLPAPTTAVFGICQMTSIGVEGEECSPMVKARLVGPRGVASEALTQTHITEREPGAGTARSTSVKVSVRPSSEGLPG
jgi:hypothetical protein